MCATGAISRSETQSSSTLVSMTTGTTEACWRARGGDGLPRRPAGTRSPAVGGGTDDLTERRVAAIGGLAGSYATSKDAEYLRGLYARVNSDRLRDAIMSGVATIGGKASRDWIISIARDPNAPIQQRKRAISMAERLGLSATELSALYDSIEDGEVRATLIQQLAQNGTRVATDKLVSIAKSDPLVSKCRGDPGAGELMIRAADAVGLGRGARCEVRGARCEGARVQVNSQTPDDCASGRRRERRL
jgi:hypothetical protein